jgi:hypothetical protein
MANETSLIARGSDTPMRLRLGHTKRSIQRPEGYPGIVADFAQWNGNPAVSNTVWPYKTISQPSKKKTGCRGRAKDSNTRLHQSRQASQERVDFRGVSFRSYVCLDHAPIDVADAR